MKIAPLLLARRVAKMVRASPLGDVLGDLLPGDLRQLLAPSQGSTVACIQPVEFFGNDRFQEFNLYRYVIHIGLRTRSFRALVNDLNRPLKVDSAAGEPNILLISLCSEPVKRPASEDMIVAVRNTISAAGQSTGPQIRQGRSSRNLAATESTLACEPLRYVVRYTHPRFHISCFLGSYHWPRTHSPLAKARGRQVRCGRFQGMM
ncbi:hypothetical protein BDV96DRAFT_244206 [Lophiotrema nucula]|uniref:Uncharacterized protein n=1 Tax=Lophiotrema nucula TaxID=690887 RepID=A0A6A5YQP8_9PLEO|nr:hypothetical protein BDV96DRAFT_244206 [Lophiotrema nucula]